MFDISSLIVLFYVKATFYSDTDINLDVSVKVELVTNIFEIYNSLLTMEFSN